MLNICIGYDKNEPIAYHVLCHSILRRASRPVCITPLYLPQLREAGLHTRERDPRQSTDFTFTRFLTPWLAGGGTSIFMDSDMLCLADICELESIARVNALSDVLVVKHDYTPNPDPKFLDQEQTTYPCKNWSSLMVFNGHRSAVRTLTPQYIDAATAMELHQFQWCRPDAVGALPPEWNHLVGEYEPNPAAKLVHFTRGGPWFEETYNCEYSRLWRKEMHHALSAAQ